jgi:DNA-binding CsgD family transcriptional regulator
MQSLIIGGSDIVGEDDDFQPQELDEVAPEDQLARVDELRTLYKIHHDIWDESILEQPFRFYYLYLLHPRERQLVDFKIRKKSNSEISILMGVKPSTVLRSIYNILYIFRNRARRRVYKFWALDGHITKKNFRARRRNA